MPASTGKSLERRKEKVFPLGIVGGQLGAARILHREHGVDLGYGGRLIRPQIRIGTDATRPRIFRAIGKTISLDQFNITTAFGALLENARRDSSWHSTTRSYASEIVRLPAENLS